MDTADPLTDEAADLVAAARTFRAAAQQPNCHLTAPASLALLEETLQVLSGAWYQVAADASPAITERRGGRHAGAPSRPLVDGLSREQEACMMATLHDVAAALARCAGACRDGRMKAAPIIARRTAAQRVEGQRRGRPFTSLESRPRPPQRLA